MPIYRHFYIEHHGHNGWGIPSSFTPDANMFHPELGQFAWVHPRAGWLDLFWGDEAKFPFHLGTPSDWGNSPLLNHLEKVHNYDFGINEDGVAWLPVSELFLDEWQNETVLVGYRVEARWVSYFGDGNSSFPTVLLDKPEFNADMFFRERARQWPGDPICGIRGSERFRLSKLPPDAGFNVTCRETIAEYVGLKHAQIFRDLRNYGRDEDLRILSVRG